MKILTKTIIIESLPYFFFSFIILTFLGLLQRLLTMVNLIFTRNADIGLVIKIFLNFIPTTISVTVPMSILISVLMVYGRMSGDKEIIAIRACGINLIKIINPILVISLLLSIILIALNLNFIPNTFYNARSYLYRLTISSPFLNISEYKFNQLGNIILKVNNIDSKNLSFTNIHIEYINDKTRIILAKSGQIVKDKTGYNLVINDASIHQIDPDGKYKIINPIKQMIIPLDSFSNNINDIYEKTIKMMTFTELVQFIKNFNPSKYRLKELISAKIYLVEMLVIPFACLAFSFIAAPLGLISKSGKSIGFGLSFILIFIYYVLLSLGETISYKNIISPYWILWMPDIVLIIIGILLMKKVIYA